MTGDDAAICELYIAVVTGFCKGGHQIFDVVLAMLWCAEAVYYFFHLCMSALGHAAYYIVQWLAPFYAHVYRVSNDHECTYQA